MVYSGSAKTRNANQYVQQLCKHWSHRYRTDFATSEGTVDFGDGSQVRMHATSETLELEVICDAAAAESMKQVIEEHIQRFAFKEGALSFIWL